MNEMFKKYRHELKYLITNVQAAMLKNRVQNLLDVDKHARVTGGYSIRSLYFDDYEHSCFYENENGTDPREKFRIRIYNHSTDRITLECKRKERGKTLKTSCPLTLEQTKQLMEGKYLPDIANQPEVLREALIRQAEKLAAEGIPEEDFLRMKRSALGRRIRELDSFDSTCFRLCAYALSDFDYFRFPGIYRQITKADVEAFLRETVRAASCALSVIYPISQ